MVHEQTFVKVNAHCDVGVADLVSALNEFSRLHSYESCENSSGQAWGSFQYGPYWGTSLWKEIAEFVLGFLGPHLAEKVGDAARIMIRVNTAGVSVGEILIRPEALSLVTRDIKALAADYCRLPTP